MMKKFVIGMLILSSISAFADGHSDVTVVKTKQSKVIVLIRGKNDSQTDNAAKALFEMMSSAKQYTRSLENGDEMRVRESGNISCTEVLLVEKRESPVYLCEFFVNPDGSLEALRL